ncbi:MAG TPA: 1,4-dihydroxy-2-naphthoate polyprenyltransferase [Candidatus Eisenbacteria bacterium]
MSPTAEAAARPSRAAAWLHAVRVPTLAAAVVPVAVGSALAARHGLFRAGPATAALLGALLIQIGTNLANDLYDFRKGADTEHRLGPPRVIAVGWLTATEVRGAMIACFALAALAGGYLTAVAGWPIVAIGVASIAAGVGYTAGRWALAYHGLGDLAVFLFFGVVAVAGTYYVQAGTVHPLAITASIPVGALATAILVVNNVRDLETDRRAGKRTLSVLLGRRGTRVEYGALLFAAFATVIGLWIRGRLSFGALLPLATLTLAMRTFRVVATREDGAALNGALLDTARLHALFGLLFAAGILIP